MEGPLWKILFNFLRWNSFPAKEWIVVLKIRDAPENRFRFFWNRRLKFQSRLGSLLKVGRLHFGFADVGLNAYLLWNVERKRISVESWKWPQCVINYVYEKKNNVFLCS